MQPVGSNSDKERLERVRAWLAGPRQEAPPAELARAARAAEANSHSPHSNLAVGAALVFESGALFTGTNVECASYGLTQCAERVAIGSAITAGHRTLILAVITSSVEQVLAPCGACRQVMREFGGKAVVVSVGLNGDFQQWSMGELLPDSFSSEDLPS